MANHLFPLFLKLDGRKVVVVGGGPVAAAKLGGLVETGAHVTVIAPEVEPELAATPGIVIVLRDFVASDLDGAWLVIAAATPAVNREVAAAAETRRVFVNAVDDRNHGTAYTGGVLRKRGVTIAGAT